MDYQIALAPTVAVTPDQFAAAWNQDPATHAVGSARVTQAAGAQYEPLSMGAVLVSIAVGVATSALYDLIKELLIKEGVQQRIEIREIQHVPGDRIIIVTITEE